MTRESRSPSILVVAAVAAVGAFAPSTSLAGTPRAAERSRFVPGEVIVSFDGGASLAKRSDAIDKLGGTVRRRLLLPRTSLLRLPAGGRVEAAVAQLRSTPRVAFAQPNYIREATAVPNDPLYGPEWGLENTGQNVNGTLGTPDADTDAEAAWNVQTGSSAVTVAIADSGIDYTHPDLATNIWANSGETPNNSVDDDGNGKIDDSRGWDFVDGDANPYDEEAHGTHVAGTVGAVGNNGIGITGVAWDVSLMPVRVLDATGHGTDAGIADGFVYAAQEGADIVNASLGGTGASPLMTSAIASHPDTLFVAAAGNNATDDDSVPFLPCTSAPANLICVAATDQFDQLASFSNYGASSVDLAAPGVNIASTFPQGYTTENVLSEDFEAGFPAGWTTGGTGNWSATGVFAPAGAMSLTDSPSGNYSPNADSWAKSPPLDLSGLKDCRLNYTVSYDVENGDHLLVEASTNGTTWTQVNDHTGQNFVFPDVDASALDGAATAYIRFRLTSDASVEGDGAYVDDVAVNCLSTDPPAYNYLDGTSMAAPHVSGAAALVLSQHPGYGVADLRSALLGSVDTKASLAGKVVTGGRLNIAKALNSSPQDTAPPQTTISSGPKKKSKDRRPKFKFNASEPSTFECHMDSAKWSSCSSPQSYKLKPGSHTFSVRATDTAHNTDASPARYPFKIVKDRRA